MSAGGWGAAVAINVLLAFRRQVQAYGVKNGQQEVHIRITDGVETFDVGHNQGI